MTMQQRDEFFTIIAAYDLHQLTIEGIGLFEYIEWLRQATQNVKALKAIDAEAHRCYPMSQEEMFGPEGSVHEKKKDNLARSTP